MTDLTIITSFNDLGSLRSGFNYTTFDMLVKFIALCLSFLIYPVFVSLLTYRWDFVIVIKKIHKEMKLKPAWQKINLDIFRSYFDRNLIETNKQNTIHLV